MNLYKLILKNKSIVLFGVAILLMLFGISIAGKSNEVVMRTSATEINIENLDNTKIGWGIKRNDNHEQPDLVKKNK